MKEVTRDLSDYLMSVKNITSCNLYDLKYATGEVERFTDADIDLVFDGNTYFHNRLLFAAEQIKINSTVVVDSMTVTITAGKEDTLRYKQALKQANDGILDRASLKLRRAFFRNTAVVGTIPLFSGNVEVKSAGGLSLKLTIKANTQGLNVDFPVRKYYPQGLYTVNSETRVISSSDTDKSALIAPFIPRKEILL